jgi:hypothetical protein
MKKSSSNTKTKTKTKRKLNRDMYLEFEHYKKYWLNTNDTPRASKLIADGFINWSSLHRQNINIISRQFTSSKNHKGDVQIAILKTAKGVSGCIGYINIPKNEFLQSEDKKWKFLQSKLTFNVGSPLNSMDGEYRGHTICSVNFILIERNFPKIVGSIRQYNWRMGTMPTYKIITATTGEVSKKLIDIKESIDIATNRVLYITWFIAMYKLHFNVVEKHMSENYMDLIFIESKLKDLNYFKKTISKYGEGAIHRMFKMATDFIAQSLKVNLFTYVSFGQKLIPMSLTELSNIFNPIYKIWKELFISHYIQDTILRNNRAYGFPKLVSWTFVKTPQQDVFFNESQKIRALDGKKAIHSIRVLNKLLSGVSSDNDDGKGRMNCFITKIKNSINYATSEIVLTDLSLLMILEHVGHTFYNSILLLKSSATYRKLMGDPISFTGFPNFEKYMFEICHNLYNMSKIGIIHGDLHINNATVMPNYHSKSKKVVENVETPVEIFTVGKENIYSFIVPTHGFHAAIIDFSRSIVNVESKEIPHAIVNIYGREMKNVFQTSKFTEDNVKTLTNLYIKSFPEMIPRAVDIRTTIENEYAASFTLLSLLDIYKFATSVNTMFLTGTTLIQKVPKAHLVLMGNLINNIEVFLITEFEKLIDDNLRRSVILNGEAPMVTIMLKTFPHLLLKETSSGNVVSVYRSSTNLPHLEKVEVRGFDLISKEGNRTFQDGGKSYSIPGERIDEQPIGVNINDTKQVARAEVRHYEKLLKMPPIYKNAES